jgi:hypothetical protein
MPGEAQTFGEDGDSDSQFNFSAFFRCLHDFGQRFMTMRARRWRRRAVGAGMAAQNDFVRALQPVRIRMVWIDWERLDAL